VAVEVLIDIATCCGGVAVGGGVHVGPFATTGVTTQVRETLPLNPFRGDRVM